MNRETWLNLMADKMRPRFAELGYPLPKFRVSVGFTSAGKVSNVGGECWHYANSGDKVFEIFIAPITENVMEVTAILAHELTHAAVGFEHKHKGEFAKVMLALGMQRPMTSSTAGDVFKAFAQPFIDELGPLPHARLSWGSTVRPVGDNDNAEDGEGEAAGGSSNAKPKQKTRMLKATCKAEGCGYTVRLSKKWADELGADCPTHGRMEIDYGDAAPADDEAEAA
jgi:hypothetical protein